MNTILTFLFLASSFISFSQSANLVGDYKLNMGEREDHLLDYDLTLNQDGTFVFHYHSFIKQGTPTEITKYGKGNWAEKDNVISFTSNKENDFNEKYTLNFNNTKARFITKSPRNKSEKIIKTRIQFLDSEIFWMKRIEMLKI